MDIFRKVELGLFREDKPCYHSSLLRFEYEYGTKKDYISPQHSYCFCKGFLWGEGTDPSKEWGLSDEEKTSFLQSIEKSRQDLMVEKCKDCWVFQEVVSKTEDKMVKGLPEQIRDLEDVLHDKKCDLIEPDGVDEETIKKEISQMEDSLSKLKKDFKLLHGV